MIAKYRRKRLKATSDLALAVSDVASREHFGSNGPLLLDSSAIVALILREPGWESFRDRIEAAPAVSVSAVTLLETHLVLTGRTGRDAFPILDAFVQEIGAAVLPFTETHWKVAADAFLRYGKGRNPAALNFGDCIAYATAHSSRLPLLYKGDDFGLTDLALSTSVLS